MYLFEPLASLSFGEKREYCTPECYQLNPHSQDVSDAGASLLEGLRRGKDFVLFSRPIPFESRTGYWLLLLDFMLARYSEIYQNRRL